MAYEDTDQLCGIIHQGSDKNTVDYQWENNQIQEARDTDKKLWLSTQYAHYETFKDVVFLETV